MQSIKVLKTKHVLNMQTVFSFFFTFQTIPNICNIAFVEHVKAYSAVLMLFP